MVHKINNIYNDSLDINIVGINTNPGNQNSPYGAYSDPGIPVIAPYNRTQFLENYIAVPEYIFSSRVNAKDINLNLSEKLQQLLDKEKIDINNVDFNVNIQTNRWHNEDLLFRPHSYIDPGLSFSQPNYNKETTIKYVITDNLSALDNIKQSVSHTHQGTSSDYQQGVVYSPNNMSISKEYKNIKLDKNSTNCFYSICIIPNTKIGITFHVLLSDIDRNNYISKTRTLNKNFFSYVNYNNITNYMLFMDSFFSSIKIDGIQDKIFDFMPSNYIPNIENKNEFTATIKFIEEYDKEFLLFNSYKLNNSNKIDSIYQSSSNLNQNEKTSLMPEDILSYLEKIREQREKSTLSVEPIMLLKVIDWCHKSIKSGDPNQEPILKELVEILNFKSKNLQFFSDEDLQCFDSLDNAKTDLTKLKKNLYKNIL